MLVCDIDDDPIERLQAFAREHNIAGADFNGVGAFRQATIRYFDWESKQYRDNQVPGQVEVAAIAGNIALEPDGSGHKVHAHVVLGRPDGSALAGHLKSAQVRPTLEMVLNEHTVPLEREHDQQTGLDLIRW